MVLELGTQILHLGHIGVQDHLNDAFFEKLMLHWCQLIANEVVFVAVQQLQRLRNMETFLDVCVTVHEEAIRLGDNVEFIIESIVANVMAEGSN